MTRESAIAQSERALIGMRSNEVRHGCNRHDDREVLAPLLIALTAAQAVLAMCAADMTARTSDAADDTLGACDVALTDMVAQVRGVMADDPEPDDAANQGDAP